MISSPNSSIEAVRGKVLQGVKPEEQKNLALTVIHLWV